MPDLGQYASTVVAAYAVGLALLVVLTLLSLYRSAKAKKQLLELEQRRKTNG